VRDVQTGERSGDNVTPGTGFWGCGLWYHNDGDSISVKAIDSAKDTVAETFYDGPTNATKSVPTLFAYGHGLNIRNTITASEDSTYGKCNIVSFLDTVYGKFLSNYPGGPTERFRVYFDGTRLPDFQHGRDFRIEVRLRDSAAVSTGTIEGKFIDADTAPHVTLAFDPGFRDVAITRCAGLPDTIDAGGSYSRDVSVRNNSDLRDEDVTVVMTRRRNGVTLDSAATTLTLKPPHFQPDTAFVGFPDWQVAPADSGVNVLDYLITPSDSVPDNNLRSETVFVRDGVGLTGEGQSRTVKVQPTVMRAPVDLRQVKGELRDVLGRRVIGVRLEAGIYYLVAPERTRKLLVVN
jgi:hypothetical protein